MANENLLFVLLRNIVLLFIVVFSIPFIVLVLRRLFYRAPVRIAVPPIRDLQLPVSLSQVPSSVLVAPQGKYRRRNWLSEAEICFLRYLDEFVNGRARVFSKVRLADLAETNSRRYFSGFNPFLKVIADKHVDFLLCDSSLSTLCAIELDDKSQLTEKSLKRDDLLDSVYQDIGLPVVHISCAASYSPSDFKALNEYLTTVDRAA